MLRAEIRTHLFVRALTVSGWTDVVALPASNNIIILKARTLLLEVQLERNVIMFLRYNLLREGGMVTIHVYN